jgi:putative ABC transport system substrate-binding protein
MRRRDFIRLVAGVAAFSPCAAFAQQAGRTYRIGVFSGADNRIMRMAYQGFLDELRRLGFVEGSNLTVEFRSTVQSTDTLNEQAREFVRQKVDLIAALGVEHSLKASFSATRSIPIVFVANNYDPIAAGYVRSLAKPGGNVTGIFLRQTELAEKQVELLTEAMPGQKKLAVLWDYVSADQFVAAEKRARVVGLDVISLRMEKPPYALEAAFAGIEKAGAKMLLALTSPFFAQQSGQLTELAVRHRLASMFIFKPYTLAGGLMSYGADNVAMYRQGAGHVAKVLQGANPADLPVELPTNFEFIVNLKTAKAIGIELPTSILLRANDVIE